MTRSPYEEMNVNMACDERLPPRASLAFPSRSTNIQGSSLLEHRPDERGMTSFYRPLYIHLPTAVTKNVIMPCAAIQAAQMHRPCFVSGTALLAHNLPSPLPQDLLYHTTPASGVIPPSVTIQNAPSQLAAADPAAAASC